MELGDHTTLAIDILLRARILDEENITPILQYPQYAEYHACFRDWVRALIAEYVGDAATTGITLRRKLCLTGC